MYNYTNYYMLSQDLLHIFPTDNYIILYIAELLVIGVSIALFYFPICTQIFYYYFLSPNLTVENKNTISQQKERISYYLNVKEKFKLECITSTNNLGIRDLETGGIMEALTLTRQVITNCNLLGIN